MFEIKPSLAVTIDKFYNNPSVDGLEDIISYDTSLLEILYKSGGAGHNARVKNSIKSSAIIRKSVDSVGLNYLSTVISFDKRQDVFDRIFEVMFTYVDYWIDRKKLSERLVEVFIRIPDSRVKILKEFLDLYPLLRNKIEILINTSAISNDTYSSAWSLFKSTVFEGIDGLLPTLKQLYKPKADLDDLIEPIDNDDPWAMALSEVAEEIERLGLNAEDLSKPIDNDDPWAMALAETPNDNMKVLGNKEDILGQDEIDALMRGMNVDKSNDVFFNPLDRLTNVKKFNIAMENWIARYNPKCYNINSDKLFEVVVLLNEDLYVESVDIQESKFSMTKILLTKNDAFEAKRFIDTLLSMGYFAENRKGSNVPYDPFMI